MICYKPINPQTVQNLKQIECAGTISYSHWFPRSIYPIVFLTKDMENKIGERINDSLHHITIKENEENPY